MSSASERPPGDDDTMAGLGTLERPVRGPESKGLPELLARLARTLSSHWKRSLAAAVGALVLLAQAAGAAGKASDD